MSPGSSTESYSAFAHIGLRETPEKKPHQVTCPDQQSNPGHLVSRPDALTVTPQNGKATVVDGIPIELVKCLGEDKKEILELCIEIYEKGEWPEDFTETLLIPIPEKNNAKKCNEFRTIGLISHSTKILLRILNRRLYSKMEEQLEEEQFGFRKGKGRIRNEAVLERVGEKRIMLKVIRKRKRNWLGHWVKRNCLLKDALEGMVNGETFGAEEDIR
ncbi:hypothetical protein ANN_19828 [Periplaneta americana]|uniref:Reverse transcriptase domain-containing protein n=1 Tax=Periplaneta americana TaxID=6978 RepID=A0ABQ8SAY2_PERAM|nr:hypothetical protein ANN_19828 [Periplaneta americana]